MIIYKLTNLINNKVYIGLTTLSNSKMRYYRHKSNAKLGIDGFLYNAIRKYNIDNFKFEEIYCSFSKEDLMEKETFFIKFYKSNNKIFGYNLNLGGNIASLSLESRKNLSEKIKLQFKTGRPILKSRLGISPKNKGIKGIIKRNISDETKSRISNALKNKKKTIQHKMNLAESKINYFKINTHVKAKTIICINDNLIFKSAVLASKYYNIPITAAARVANGSRKSYKKLIFKYISDNERSQDGR